MHAVIQLMGAQVSHVSIARIPIPMPIVMQSLTHKRLHRRRTRPKIVIHALRNRLRSSHPSQRLALFVPQTMHPLDLTNIALANVLNRLPKPSVRTVLSTRLNDTLILASCLNDLLAFPKIMGNRLFHVDILARLTCPNGSQSVPMIRRGNDHRIYLRIVKQTSHIAVALRLDP